MVQIKDLYRWQIVMVAIGFLWGSHQSGVEVLAKGNKPLVKAKKKLIKEGRALYEMNGCSDCHLINNKGCASGVDLSGLGKNRSRQFIEEHLKDPEDHVKKNATAFENAPNMMPDMNLGKREISAIAEYLHSVKADKPEKKNLGKQSLPKGSESKSSGEEDPKKVDAKKD